MKYLTACVHRPQFFGSVPKLAHVPPQQASSTPVHAEPGQPPQWSRLEVGSIQMPRQQVVVGATHYINISIVEDR
jgi:hypothetical protein